MSPRTETKSAPFRTNLRRVVLERIVGGELVPGVRIKESQLAKELGASRTPLREALINLEQEGFVRSELDRGFSVQPLSGREVRETYPILWTLESLALRASGIAVYSRLEDISRINAQFSKTKNPHQRLRYDAHWHETLLSCCPNQRLNALLTSLRTTIRRYEQIYMSDSVLVAESVRQHQQIIEALQAENIERAEELLTENWRMGMELLLVRLGEP
jgi:DNA-binding GntR family transcriptional regulator